MAFLVGCSFPGWGRSYARCGVSEHARFLTAVDRCDWPRCGARAYARVYFDGDPKPLWLDACAHHFREAPASLLMQSMYHLDETEYVLEAD